MYAHKVEGGEDTHLSRQGFGVTVGIVTVTDVPAIERVHAHKVEGGDKTHLRSEELSVTVGAVTVTGITAAGFESLCAYRKEVVG